MEPLEGRLAKLIAAETHAVTPPADAKARHWVAVSAALGGGTPQGGAPAGAEAAVGVAAVKSGALIKIIGGAVVAGALVVGGFAARDRPTDPPIVAAMSPSSLESPPTAGSPEPAPPRVDEATSTAAPKPEPREEFTGTATPDADDPRPPTRLAKPTATPNPATRPSPAPRGTAQPRGLAEELRLVEALRMAVVRGDLAKAETLAARHRREFPEGALIPDRLDLEVTARCAGGDLAGGRALARELRERWPDAPMSARSSTACHEPEPQEPR